MLVLDHSSAVRHFKMRQIELAVLAGWMLFLSVISPYEIPRIVLLVLAMTFVGLGTREATRFRACGRSYQCKRSIEILGF